MDWYHTDRRSPVESFPCAKVSLWGLCAPDSLTQIGYSSPTQCLNWHGTLHSRKKKCNNRARASYPTWLQTLPTLPTFIWIPWPRCSACFVPFRFFQFLCVHHWEEQTESVLRHITNDGSSVSGRSSRNCPSSCRSRSSLSSHAQPPVEPRTRRTQSTRSFRLWCGSTVNLMYDLDRFGRSDDITILKDQGGWWCLFGLIGQALPSAISTSGHLYWHTLHWSRMRSDEI